MADLFKEVIPSILQTKKDVMQTELDEKEYVPFIVNRALSYHRDTCLIANEVNKYPGLDSKMAYSFLLNMVKPYKRPFVKWSKGVKPDDLFVIKEYYGYSDSKAYEVLSILTDDQIEELRKRIYKGD